MPDFPNLEVGGTGFKLNDIYADISPQALGQLVDYITQSGIPIPVTQIVGFSGFTAKTASIVSATETRTSSTFGDLTTVGPTLSGLPDGQYLLLYGCTSWIGTVGAGKGANMSVQVNSASATTADQTVSQVGNPVSVMVARTKTLNGGGNTITAKYASTDNVATASFSDRWLIALKYANA